MSKRRNVVLVTVDSLRADYCGFMGSDRGLTPNMDRHAERGLVFNNAVAPGPSTLDAMPGVFTGADLVDGDGSEDPRTRVRHHLRARETIPERFAAAGYETAAFTANPWTSRQYGFDAGFDEFEDFLDGAADDEREEGRDGGADGSGGENGRDATGPRGDGSALAYPVRLVRRWAGNSRMFQSWGSFYDDAVAWTERASEPYFLWLFLVDVHMPYLPVEGSRSQSWPTTYAANLWLYLTGHGTGMLESAFRPALVRAYEDTIRYTDRLFGEFLADLPDDPVVALHADHGEAFGEGGVYGHGPTLSEEQVHVPLFVANGPEGEIQRPFSLRALPDLLATLGAGDDDVTALTGPYASTRNRDPKFALRGEGWKYVDDQGEGTLYDIDGGEATPRSDPELRGLAGDIVTRWKRHERERTRVADAARAVTESEDV